ncbi:MAG TPA: ATP-binding protein [Microlunatus sp.]|nr:ATP-binding protein [Microlunatus sp.]
MKSYSARRAPVATVHLLAGLNGSDRTTFARELELRLPAVRFTLEEWMLRLFGLRPDDPRYGEPAGRCQDLIWDTARQVLHAGTDVILDWNQDRRAGRAGWRDRARLIGARPVLHYLKLPPEGPADRAGADQRSFEEPDCTERLEVRMVYGPAETPVLA